MVVAKVESVAGKRSLPEGWRWVRFDEMAESITERVDDPSEAGVDFYVGLEHLDPDSLRIRRWGTPEDVAATKLRFRPGDIIFGRRRAYQRKIAVADFEGICSAHALVLRAREEIVDKKFLPFFMQSDAFFNRALSISVGSLSPTINWRTLARQEFAVPPKTEQRRIAEILFQVQIWRDRLDDVEGRMRKVITSTRSAAFSQREESNCPTVSLVEVSLDVRNGMSVPKESRGGGVGIVNMGELFSGEIIPLESLEKVPASEAELSRFGLREGDLLFARRSIVFEGAGKCSIVPMSSEPVVFESSLIRVRPNPQKVRPLFLHYFFNSHPGRQLLRSITRRGAVAGIAGSDLKKLPVPCPELRDQDKIIYVQAQLSRCLELVSTEQFQARRLSEFLPRELGLT